MLTSTTAVYSSYGLAVLGALGVYLAMPGGGRRRGVPALLIGIIAAFGLMVLLLTQYAGTTGQRVSFFVLATTSLLGAVRVITHARPVYSAVYFVLVALSSTGLVVASGAEFLGAALVIVYAGAILVTYVFVIMLAQPSDSEMLTRGGPLDYDAEAREPALAVVAGFLLIAVLGGMLLGRSWPAAAASESAAVGNTLGVGQVMLTRYAVSVELAGVLLLVAIVGAIALARKIVSPDPAARPPEGMAVGEIGRRVKPF